MERQRLALGRRLDKVYIPSLRGIPDLTRPYLEFEAVERLDLFQMCPGDVALGHLGYVVRLMSYTRCSHIYSDLLVTRHLPGSFHQAPCLVLLDAISCRASRRLELLPD